MSRTTRRKLRQMLELEFQGLRGKRWRVTSKSTIRYNCFAWAVGENHRRIDTSEGHWPNNIPRDNSIVTLVKVYQTKGFVVCDEQQGRIYDSRVDTIVLYVQRCIVNPGMPTQREIHNGTHAARLLPTGEWTSKLGHGEDIAHPTPECISGRLYGEPLIYMQRRKKNGQRKTR